LRRHPCLLFLSIKIFTSKLQSTSPQYLRRQLLTHSISKKLQLYKQKMPTIQELPNTKTSHAAPGWAYVLEPAIDPSHLAIQPTGARSQKRTTGTRTATDTLLGAHTKTQAAKNRARIEEISRDNTFQSAKGDHGGDGGWVPASARHEITEARWKITKGAGKSVGSGAAGKQATNVKRVLASTKTWAHHAGDEEARVQLAGQTARNQQSGRTAKAQVSDSRTLGSNAEDLDAQILNPSASTSEENILLKVGGPVYPSQDVIEALIKAPPLTYAAASAPESAIKTPQRKFCDMCGYWGKMRCTVCGTYVCSLPCKVTHDAAEHPHR
jgi:zinc finger HIT domain-containing protein 1